MESLLWGAVTDELRKHTPIIKTFFHNVTQGWSACHPVYL